MTATANTNIGGDHPRTAPLAASAPQVRRCALLGAAVLGLAILAGPAAAQPGKKGQPAGPSGGAKDTPPSTKNPAPPAGAVQPAGNAPRGGKAKVFDFTGLDISGRLRTPQLLYFLDRANEELERASLERRSFIPEMVRSVDEGNL